MLAVVVVLVSMLVDVVAVLVSAVLLVIVGVGSCWCLVHGSVDGSLLFIVMVSAVLCWGSGCF